jgi:CRP-like cAMP-binding protein
VLESIRARLDELPLQMFAAGERLLEAGTRSGRLLFLEQGRVAVTREGVTITRIRQAGAVLGEMSLLLDAPHTADVVAIEPTRCRVIENAGVYLLGQPAMMAYVAAVLAHRLDAATRYLVDVKAQFAEGGTHLGMIDEVLESLASRQPRAVVDRALG